MTDSETGASLIEVTLRYNDMDVQGHLNNAVYATLFEAGRVAFIAHYLAEVTPEGAGYVIVRLTIDFKAEARYPGTAHITTQIAGVGGSSMTYRQEISIGGKRVATAESICALFDQSKRKAMRAPPALRTRMLALMHKHQS